MRQDNHRWIPRDIIGANSALDLVNTVSAGGDDPEDCIPDAGGFLDWARMGGLLNIYEKNQAAQIAAAFPDSVERVLAALKELRFALWHLIDSLQHGKPAKPGYVSVLNDWARRLGLSRHV